MAIDCIYGSKIRLLKKFKALTSKRRGERLQHNKLPRHKWLAQSIKSFYQQVPIILWIFIFFERKKNRKKKDE